MKPVNISIVLDRSGSMEAIADDIVGGFNSFLRSQREEHGEARLTLAQFDSEDPFEVLIDSRDLAQVEKLDPRAYQPRSMTPLFDAVGRMIVRVDSEIARRHDLGLPSEDQVVLIITDGLENASSDFSREKVFSMVNERRERGWVFVFLGAEQDAYAEGGKVGVSQRNRARWDKSQAGARKLWRDVDHSVKGYRKTPHEERASLRDAFYEEAPGQDASDADEGNRGGFE